MRVSSGRQRRATTALTIIGAVLLGGCGNMLDQNRGASPPPASTPPPRGGAPSLVPAAPASTPTSAPASARATAVEIPQTMPSLPGTPQPVTALPPPVATADLDRRQPLPGLIPPPKPFIATGRFEPKLPPAEPSPLLVEHASPDAPVALSEYGRQAVHAVEDFDLGPDLTGTGLQERLGPPAGLAGINDPWRVYRLTYGRELWLHFAGGDGPLLAADLVRGAENGYVRDRLYPTR